MCVLFNIVQLEHLFASHLIHYQAFVQYENVLNVTAIDLYFIYW